MTLTGWYRRYHSYRIRPVPPGRPSKATPPQGRACFLVSVGSGDRGTRATLPIGYDGPLPLRVQRGFLSDTTGWSIHGSALGGPDGTTVVPMVRFP